MVAIIDYGVGNLFSLLSSLECIGVEAKVTNDREEIQKSERIILPGVGAFADARRKLRQSGVEDLILEEVQRGKPLLGICLGMQMLFDKSYEYGVHDGLGLISGNVTPLAPRIHKDLKIPHIGWNALSFPEKGKRSKLYRYVGEVDCVYFVHSFAAEDCEDSITATAEYGVSVTASVERGNVFGTQFHPEKSGEVGLKILKAFCEE